MPDVHATPRVCVEAVFLANHMICVPRARVRVARITAASRIGRVVSAVTVFIFTKWR